MIDRHWERITGAAGIAGIILLLTSLFLPGNQLHGDESVTVVANTLADNRAGVLAGIELQVASILLFFVFVTGLCVSLRRADGDTSALAPLAFGAGLLGGMVVLLDNGILAGITAGIAGPLQHSGATLVWALYQVYKAVGYAIDPLLGIFVLTSSFLLVRGAAVPRWISGMGLLVGALLILAAFAVTSWAATDWTGLFGFFGLLGTLGLALWSLSLSTYLLVKGIRVGVRARMPVTAQG